MHSDPMTTLEAITHRIAPGIAPEDAQILRAAVLAAGEKLHSAEARIARLERTIAASKQGFSTSVAAYRSLLETFQTFRRTIDRILQLTDLEDLPEVLEAIRMETHLPAVRLVLDADLFARHLPEDIPAAPASELLDRLTFLEDRRGRLSPYIGPAARVPDPAFFLGLDLPGRGSCVIFPLRHKYDARRTIGIFSALDTDPERFSRTKATDFLDHFCAILSSTLVTALEHAELDALTVRDSLTGIHNRAYMERHAPRLLDLARRKGRSVQLLFIDLDGFKAVNDRLGHDVGDLVLVQVARTLAGMVRSYDICVRLGGDEFAILMPESSPEDARTLTRRLEEAVLGIHIPAHTGMNHQIRVSASIGIASWQPDWSFEELLRQADVAMYAAKARRGQSITVREPLPSSASHV
ncbi:MAG: sensor domain-containing diguanylate cyclase [Desulfomicrobiaceae bacterium]